MRTCGPAAGCSSASSSPSSRSPSAASSCPAPSPTSTSTSPAQPRPPLPCPPRPSPPQNDAREPAPSHPSVHPGLVLAAACWLGACAVPLAFIDAAARRLPDRLTIPAYAGTAALLLAAA